MIKSAYLCQDQNASPFLATTFYRDLLDGIYEHLLKSTEKIY